MFGCRNIALEYSAENDLNEAFRFYESQAVGLGYKFLDFIVSEIDALYIHAGIHPVDGQYFVAVKDRFPCAIYYVLQGSTAVVHAVIDTRRDPQSVKLKLR